MKAAFAGAAISLCATMIGAAPAGASLAKCAQPAGVYRDGAGWAQRITDASAIWPLTDGSGQLVAVLGTGVDPRNAQFAPDRVVAGSDMSDCDGRGTIAAGIVAARPDPGTTFTGMAPGARILALRYTETTTGGLGDSEPEPDKLAAAMNSAVDAGATVILVVAASRASTPALAAAARNALSRNVVVVAPVVGDKPGVRSYPAGLPGVIGVAARDEAGAAAQTESGEQVSISAPGKSIVSTAAGSGGKLGHMWGMDNTGFAAAASVAGAVALVRAYRPALTPPQILDRLTRTANRPPGGDRDPQLGWGLLDVHAAVTAELSDPPGPPRRTDTVTPAAPPPEPPARNRLPGLLAIAGVGLAVLAVVARRVIRKGRARGWQP